MSATERTALTISWSSCGVLTFCKIEDLGHLLFVVAPLVGVVLVMKMVLEESGFQ